MDSVGIIYQHFHNDTNPESRILTLADRRRTRHRENGAKIRKSSASQGRLWFRMMIRNRLRCRPEAVKTGHDQKPVAIWTGKNEFFVQAPQTDRQPDRQTNSQTVMYRSFPVVGSSLLPRGQKSRFSGRRKEITTALARIQLKRHLIIQLRYANTATVLAQRPGVQSNPRPLLPLLQLSALERAHMRAAVVLL